MSTDAITALVIFGLGLLIGGFALYAGIDSIKYQRRKIENETERVTGTLVRIDRVLVRGPYSGGRPPVAHYKPVIRFTAGEKEYTLRYGVSMRSKDERAVGDPVDVCYDPKDPEKFHIAGDETDGRLGRKAVIIGIVIILAAAAWALIKYCNISLISRPATYGAAGRFFFL